MLHSRYRYKDYFVQPDEIITILKNTPFLNGGLFECLDVETEPLTRIDGFSDRADNELNLPNYLFFSEKQTVDLNEDYGTKNKKYKVRGLIDLLQSYKFTIVENTPIEEEIALDPPYPMLRGNASAEANGFAREFHVQVLRRRHLFRALLILIRVAAIVSADDRQHGGNEFLCARPDLLNRGRIDAHLGEDIVLSFDPGDRFLNVGQNGSMQQVRRAVAPHQITEHLAVEGVRHRVAFLLRIGQAGQRLEEVGAGVDPLDPNAHVGSGRSLWTTR